MKATWFRRSVARRLDWEFARAFLLAVDFETDGSVAQDRRSFGRRLLLDLDESLLGPPRDIDAMFVFCWILADGTVLCEVRSRTENS